MPIFFEEGDGSTVNREIFVALKVGEFACFQIHGRLNSALAAKN
jgi:hypothetical protein